MTENSVIAVRVKTIRKGLDKTQFEFAADCGISIEELSLIERAKTDIKLSTLQKLAAYTGITVSELVDVDGKTDTYLTTIIEAIKNTS